MSAGASIFKLHDLRRLGDWGFAFSSLTLALQASAPLGHELPARPPVWLVVDVAALGFLLLGVSSALLSTRHDERLAAVLVAIGALFVGVHLDAWARSTPMRWASSLEAAFSTTRFGVPWTALGLTVAVFALGFLQHTAARRATRGWSGTASRYVAWASSGLGTALWLRALLGYAAGSTALSDAWM